MPESTANATSVEICQSKPIVLLWCLVGPFLTWLFQLAIFVVIMIKLGVDRRYQYAEAGQTPGYRLTRGFKLLQPLVTGLWKWIQPLVQTYPSGPRLEIIDQLWLIQLHVSFIHHTMYYPSASGLHVISTIVNLAWLGIVGVNLKKVFCIGIPPCLIPCNCTIPGLVTLPGANQLQGIKCNIDAMVIDLFLSLREHMVRV